MAIELTDDGTMDTVLRCSECGEEFRGNYDPFGFSPDDDEMADSDEADNGYDEWIAEFIAETEADHVCQSDEPQEGDITTQDHRTFYQDGRLAFEVVETATVGNEPVEYLVLVNGFQIGGQIDRSGAGNATFSSVEAAILAYMDRVQYWPSVWFISDHGNAHRMDLTERK